MVIVFCVQALTGLLMLIYYVPTTQEAHSSTLYIVKYVPLGQLIETVHLYGAYAMILLAFMHLMRGYFASVQKKPREIMWVIGMLMGFITLGFGLTGYLLPWTVVSKSATDVSIGMLSFLPAQVGAGLTFLVAGPGSSSGELRRFFDLHIAVLPAILLILLAIKLYMFEVHGIAEPPTGKKQGGREAPWFPDVFLYFAMIGCILTAVILAASVLFPLNLPAEFTPEAASAYVPQPEWYFLWIYQILKFSVFEGPGIYYALGVVSIMAVVITILPFFDRGHERDPSSRPVYTTLGIVGTAELIALTVWGYFTPGQVIPDSQALVITLGIALTISAMSFVVYRTRRILRSRISPTASPMQIMMTPFKFKALTASFAVLLVAASVAMATAANLLASSLSNFGLLSGSAILLCVCLFLMVRITRKLTSVHSKAILH
jgi:quinol-cytochrome oxidoreductase complex cytochrome b subunit